MTTEGSGSDGYVTAGEFDRDMDYIPTRVTENGENGFPVPRPPRLQIKRHHYLVHRDINPTQVVPKGPDPSGWLTPHGREGLGGRPFGDGTPPGPPPPGERV